MEKTSRNDSVKNGVLHRVKEERNIRTYSKRKEGRLTGFVETAV